MVSRDELKAKVEEARTDGIYIGTSSWKYPGWKNQLYDEARYIWRGRWSESRFERLCLAEYAEVFSTVCVDAAYYKFPERHFVEDLVSQVRPGFLFGLKVTDQITIKRFPNLPRFGLEAGRMNPGFLDAHLFEDSFLSSFASRKDYVGLLIFEFSKFHADDFARGRDFVEALDLFLSRLPAGWPYGVEIRNRNFLHPEYFSTLAKHNVAHVYNSWQDMPPLSEQISMPESQPSRSHFAARLLLRPGRKYEEAVKLFSPYAEIKDPYHEGRAAAAQLINRNRERAGQTRGYVYVNNRFEGNALETVSRILDQARLERLEPGGRPPSV